ncbi:DUF2851 family protein [Hyunsoonleella aestuarii]|uniref:DUF2851 family protein n=1 Tax=Hyunsoonleella aestuarii TaxID=912802 RepID=A0ABP8EBS5_9FLAO|nr:DUF2851 family protein [Hyunsoonleella aestuarii]
MQEDFLHYLWKHKKINLTELETTDGEPIIIKLVGEHNHNSGPDFFNAQLHIGEQLWAGNVEIHVKSSYWFVHSHEQDQAYDNVILHVVWEHDSDVFRKDNSAIPTLELKNKVSVEALSNYQKLFLNSRNWINCQNDFPTIHNFILENWLERLFIERLNRKTEELNSLLLASNNNWEAVLFKMMTKNFGLKINAESFFSVAHSFDFSIIRKLQSNQLALEALLLGQSGLLGGEVQGTYFSELKKEFDFISNKFQLNNESVLPIKFFRLRPSNFPTIRLSQLAMLYGREHNLFSKIMETNSKNEFYELFYVSTSTFWESHYTFNTASKKSKKVLSKAFIDLLLINTIIPIKFAYAKFQGKHNDEQIIKLVNEIFAEKNSIINKFNSLKKVATSALHSQGLLQLKNAYCNKNKCLQCAVGNSLLNRK